MTYQEKLTATKTAYPFARWRELFFPDPEDDDSEGMEQYTQENCDKAQAIFDTLIAKLIAAGPDADKKEKEGFFKDAILALNALNEEIDDLIETGEREDLCELIDQVTIAAGLNPADYGDGEGIADEWREW
ncbi:MAG TPA: hypothetical protein VLD19_09885 [Chitinophagaceae bacterium]|nr:hypothetical protein [Chitinophagaceae bacterium]